MGTATAFTAGTYLAGTPKGDGQLHLAVPKRVLRLFWKSSYGTPHQGLGLSVQHLVKWPGYFLFEEV